jgi:hypothetical protein
MNKILFLLTALFFIPTTYAGEFIPLAQGTVVNNSKYDQNDINFGGTTATYSRLYYSGIYDGKFTVDKYSEVFSIYDDNPIYVSVINNKTDRVLCYLGFKPSEDYQNLMFTGSYFVNGSDVNCTVTGDLNNLVLTISNKS